MSLQAFLVVKKALFKDHKCTSIILLREIWGQEGFCWRCWLLGPSLSELPLLQLMGFTPGSALSCASHPRCAALFRAKQGFCNTSASSPTQPLAEDHLQVTKALQGTWTSPGASSRWISRSPPRDQHLQHPSCRPTYSGYLFNCWHQSWDDVQQAEVGFVVPPGNQHTNSSPAMQKAVPSARRGCSRPWRPTNR